MTGKALILKLDTWLYDDDAKVIVEWSLS